MCVIAGGELLSPVVYACLSGHLDCVKLLVTHGASISTLNKEVSPISLLQQKPLSQLPSVAYL